jgi:hypothetical protein
VTVLALTGIAGTLGFAIGWAGATLRAARQMADAPPKGEWCAGLYRSRRGWWFQRQTGEWEGPYLSRGSAAANWGEDSRRRPPLSASSHVTSNPLVRSSNGHQEEQQEQ